MEQDVYEFIDEMAQDDYNNGQVMDSDDYGEFASLIREAGYTPDKSLFDYYYSCVEQRARCYSSEDDEEWEDEQDE